MPRIHPIFAALAALAASAPLAAQETGPTGRLGYLWEDHRDGTARLVLDVAGVQFRADSRRADEVRRLSGRRVRVQARREGGVLRAGAIVPLEGASADDAPAVDAKRFVTLLCRFPDVAAVPHPAETYRRWMGAGRASMHEYWTEVSGGRADVVGAGVTEWKTYPHPSARYLEPLAARALIEDCMALHDAEVDFSAVDGINVQVNAGADKPSGGGRLTLTGDGVTKEYRTTFLMTWADQGVYAHEIGHTWGLPHTFGATGTAYESPWDVMSLAGAMNAETREVEAQHTNGQYKERLGWLPAGRKVVPERGTRRTIELARAALPGATGALMVEIPVDSAYVSYTVEARTLAGYDRNLPGAAVILHTRRIYQPGNTAYAQLVSRTTGSGQPAMWRPGDTFTDDALGVSVKVLAGTDEGFTVEVRRGWELSVAATGEGSVSADAGGIACPGACEALIGTRGQAVTLRAEPKSGWSFAGWSGACAGTGACTVDMRRDRRVTARFVQGSAPPPPAVTVDAAVGHLLGRSRLGDVETGYLDSVGNNNGRYDVGDLRAWLQAARPAISPELLPLVRQLAPEAVEPRKP